MNTRRAVSLTAGLTAFAIVVGGTGAMAAWTASDDVAVTSGAATIGATIAGGDLTGQYTTSTLAFADTVTVTNTGERAADLTVTITGVQAAGTGATLPAAVAVRVGQLAAGGSCDASYADAGAVDGTLAAPPTWSLADVPAGTAVDLCVVTSLADVAGHDGEQAQFAVTGTLATVPGNAAWTTTATTDAVTQSASAPSTPGGSLLFFTNASGRYNVYVQGYSDATFTCLQRYGSVPYVAKLSGACPGNWEDQYRLTEVADGEWTISEANNSANAPSEPRWTYTGQGTALTTTSPTSSDDQRWRIIEIAAGNYRVQSVADPTQCVAVSDPTTGGIDNPNQSPWKLVFETCDLSSPGPTRQTFDFSLIGTPLPTIYTDPVNGSYWSFTSSAQQCGGPYNFAVSWPQSTEYQGEVTYRIRFTDPTDETLTMTAASSANGWWTTQQFQTGTQSLEDWWSYLVANGHDPNATTYTANLTIEVEIAGSDEWYRITESQAIQVTHNGTNNNHAVCS